MSNFLTKKVIFGFILLFILISGTVGGVYLSQQQTQLKSQAAVPNNGSINASPSSITKTNGSWPAVSLNVNINVPGANDSKTVAGIYVTKTENVPSGTGWSPTGNFYGSNGSVSASWTPSSNYPAGNYTFALFLMDGDTVVDVINTSSSVQFVDSAPTECRPGDTQYNNCRSCGGDGKWIDDYGPESDKANWCACAIKKSGADFAKSKGCNVGGASGGTNTCPVTDSCCSSPLQKCGTGATFNTATGKDTSCPVGFQWCNGGFCVNEKYNPDTKSCTVCNAEDFGDPKNKESWCACAKKHAKDFDTSPTYAACKTSGGVGNPPAGGDLSDQSADIGDSASCQYKILDDQLKENPPLTSGKQYRVKVFMTNNADTKVKANIWKKESYTLSTRNMSAWGIKDTYKLTDQESKTQNDVIANDQAIFEIPFTAPQVTKHETFPMYFVMRNAQGKWFGKACEPKEVQVQPEGAPAVSTACFVVSEDPTEVTSVTNCSDKSKVSEYKKDPTTLPYTFKDTVAGVKTLYVRFIPNVGEPKDFSKQILFAPNPTLSTISCTQSATGEGTAVTIKGLNFGQHNQQGQGSVKVKGQNADITSWDGANNIITANVTERLDGELPVELKLDDGRTVSGKCSVGISSVSFTVNTQCPSVTGAFSASGLEVRVSEATPGARPVVSQKFDVIKGVPQNLNIKIEAGKKYSLVVKAPRTLAKKVDFLAEKGTKNLGEIKLLVGDVAPKNTGDGIINVPDKSELVREWTSGKSGNIRQSDFNGDGAVNNVDYSCQKIGFNQVDEAKITN